MFLYEFNLKYYKTHVLLCLDKHEFIFVSITSAVFWGIFSRGLYLLSIFIRQQIAVSTTCIILWSFYLIWIKIRICYESNTTTVIGTY